MKAKTNATNVSYNHTEYSYQGKRESEKVVCN